MRRPIFALTQGDPAGIGPEILLRLVAEHDSKTAGWTPLLLAERAALEVLCPALPSFPWHRLVYLEDAEGMARFGDSRPHGTRHDDEPIVVLDPVGTERRVVPGQPDAADARGALAALDQGVELARSGHVAALVTAPVNKETIARHCLPDFVGHTDYLALGAGLERYGRDYLMTFLAPRLKVALLSVHCPLSEALRRVRRQAILDALRCLHRHLPPEQRRIVVAGLNPHAGEGGLLGREEEEEILPAVEEARAEGIDVEGPQSADSLFARAERGGWPWVLALYHDQGLIAVKTSAFGEATNWTLGLPYLRTSVDHGTAYDIAGRGVADASSLRAVVVSTLELVRARAELGQSTVEPAEEVGLGAGADGDLGQG